MKLYTNILLGFSLFTLAFNGSSFAQGNKTWPTCIDYSLKGKIKSWTMKNETGILRQQEFTSNGELINDSYKAPKQSDVSPEYLPETLRQHYEKTYEDGSSRKYAGTKMVFNGRKQLIEKKTATYHEINEFTEEGKIKVHKSTETITQTRAWNSTAHAEPTYTFTHTVKFLVIYKYNKAGSLLDFEYYHSDPFKNIRMAYVYDSLNHLIESNRYDNYNISIASMPDNYLDKFFDKKINADFSINDHYPDYWQQGTPTKMTWKYNSKGQKIEYIAYGYMKGPSFKATWEYDSENNLTREVHHDVYHNAI